MGQEEDGFPEASEVGETGQVHSLHWSLNKRPIITPGRKCCLKSNLHAFRSPFISSELVLSEVVTFHHLLYSDLFQTSL